LVKFGLLDAAVGPTTRVLSGYDDPQVILPFEVVELAVGARIGNRLGAAVGTALIHGYAMSDLSSFPVRGYLFYDLNPKQRWRKGAGFLSITYVHSGQDGWTRARFAPYLKLSVGASYTFYAVTPHAEIGYDGHRQMATLTAGVSLGGLHVFR
jgi:hypothetical protein